jgi:protein ImuB
VLSRLCEPLCQHLERRGRAAAILHVELKLVTRTVWARRLELPAPMKDPRTFRTLVLLDLESNPPPAGIDAVTLRVDPTPARTLQHSLLERARLQPEQVSTLVARLSALMGARRVGRPVLADSHRPDAFTMESFTGEGEHNREGAKAPLDGLGATRGSRGSRRREDDLQPEAVAQSLKPEAQLVPALRRYRPPVVAWVSVVEGRPVQVRAARAGVAGGAIEMVAGPWRCSGEWWALDTAWDHDEWDVALSGGTICRLSRDRLKNRWYVAGVYD